MSSPETLKSFSERLLTWYRSHRRDLPWRGKNDPWAIWLSEIMLQQTRVAVVQQIYPSLLERYPTVDAFATISDDELLSAWRGLGYYRRARLLRSGAAQVMERHQGSVPRDVTALCALDGVGPYTAGAIASIAFDLPELAIDGNVERVAARHREIDARVKSGPGAQAVRKAVATWQDRARPGDFNQALMELGALVCTPRAPSCPSCPVASDCKGRLAGKPEELPRKPVPQKAIVVHARAVLVRLDGGRVLGSRIPGGQVNQGQIDLPGAGPLVEMPSPAELARALKKRYGVKFRVGEVVARLEHQITNHKITLIVHRGHCAHGPGPNLMAVRPDDSRLPWTTTARKVFERAALFLSAGEA